MSKVEVVSNQLEQWASSYTGPKFHASLSDPPYNWSYLSSMWDHHDNFAETAYHWGTALKKVLHPGAVVLMFAGPRTSHLLAYGMEKAGYVIWDKIMYCFLSGLPKGQDIPLHLQRKGAEQSIVDAWSGYKTPALKPAYEEILCMRLPVESTYAETAMSCGAGALNIGGCRIGTETGGWGGNGSEGYHGHFYGNGEPRPVEGRYPANIILSEDAAALMDAEFGNKKSGGKKRETASASTVTAYGSYKKRSLIHHSDNGGMSRWFYCAKASTKERESGLEDLEPQTVDDGRTTPIDNPYLRGKTLRRNTHTCVKPLKLCEWLAKLLLPPDIVEHRRILIPFSGSGSEMIGAMKAGWDEIVGVEQSSEYCAIAEKRIAHYANEKEEMPAVETKQQEFQEWMTIQ